MLSNRGRQVATFGAGKSDRLDGRGVAYTGASRPDGRGVAPVGAGRSGGLGVSPLSVLAGQAWGGGLSGLADRASRAAIWSALPVLAGRAAMWGWVASLNAGMSKCRWEDPAPDRPISPELARFFS